MAENKTKNPTKTANPAAKKAAAMPAPYRAMGERLHALILRSAPALTKP